MTDDEIIELLCTFLDADGSIEDALPDFIYDLIEDEDECDDAIEKVFDFIERFKVD